MTRSPLVFAPVSARVVGQEEGGIVGGGDVYPLSWCVCCRLSVRSVERTLYNRVQHALSVRDPVVVGAQVVMCEDLRCVLRAGQRQEPVRVPRWIRSGFASLGVPRVW